MDVNWPLLGIVIVINVVLGVIGWFLPPGGITIAVIGTAFIFWQFFPDYRKNRIEGMKVCLFMTAVWGGVGGWLAPIASILL